MKARVWIGLAALLALLVMACNEEEPPNQPPSFDRPTRVAFACFDVPDRETARPLALACCDLVDEKPAGCGSKPALHALVVQSSRGEVAAVDLLNRETLDSREDIPGYTFLGVGELPTAIAVPARAGNSDYTYVLGSASRDVTVLRTRAFRRLAATEQATLQTVMLPGDSRDAPLDMVLSPNEDALFVSIPSTGRLLRLPIRRCESSGDDCVEGEIDVAGITEVQLSQSIARAAPPMSIERPGEPYSKPCEYSGPISNRPIAVAPLPPDAATTPPRPSGLALDDFCERDQPCRPRLLVADAALPLIHVIDLEGWQGEPTDAAIQPPILTGAPTRSVVVTPRVPVDPTPESAETQYVYAIDARDGSVLVTENGQLLEVGVVGARPDRVSLGGSPNLPVASTLTVLTPAFDVHGPAAQYTRENDDDTQVQDVKPTPVPYCLDNTRPSRDNARLRGVFLGVGASDGSVRIVDIHDMDLAACRRCPSEDKKTQDPYPLVRHRTRIIQTDNDTDSVPLGPSAAPYYSAQGTAYVVRPTGLTSDPALRGLECTPCGAGQAVAFPQPGSRAAATDAGTNDNARDAAPDEPIDAGPVDAGPFDAGPADAGLIDAGPIEGTVDAGAPAQDTCPAGEALVCALDDPWAELDFWTATYRGTLPRSRAGAGRFERGAAGVEFRSDQAFCGLGVLAQDQLGTDPAGADHLVILGDLATDAAIRAAVPGGVDRAATVSACKALVAQRDRVEDRQPIAFRILEAYDDRLVIDSNLVSRPRELERGFADDVEFVTACFANMSLIHEIRAGQGYVVVGLEQTGFLHRVVREEGTLHCTVDESQDPKRVGRAYAGTAFDNGRIAFQLRRGSDPAIDTGIVLGLRSRTLKAAMNASSTINDQVVASLPADLRWSDSDGVLYMVDVASRGLMPLSVNLFLTSPPPRSFQ